MPTRQEIRTGFTLPNNFYHPYPYPYPKKGKTYDKQGTHDE